MPEPPTTPAAVPRPVVSLQYAAPEVAGRPPVARLLLAWAACAVATGLVAFVDVKSVLVTGPILALLGGLIVFGGMRARAARSAMVGGMHCAIVALFVALVNVLHWGPEEARRPFLWIGVAYTLAMGPVTFWAMR